MTGKDYHLFQTVVEQMEDTAIRCQRYSDSPSADPIVKEFQKGMAKAYFEAVFKIKAVLKELNM